MKIEILYIDGCPNREPAVERVKATLDELGVRAEVVELLVDDSEEALALRFLGSPTIRVDGVDVEASPRASNQFGLMCRTYLDGSRRIGVPPADLIRRALEEAALEQET